MNARSFVMISSLVLCGWLTASYLYVSPIKQDVTSDSSQEDDTTVVANAAELLDRERRIHAVTAR